MAAPITLHVSVSGEERMQVTRAASAQGISMQQYIRWKLGLPVNGKKQTGWQRRLRIDAERARMDKDNQTQFQRLDDDE